jgi:hypothetical protein
MPTTLPKTKSGTPKLSEVARHLVAPIGIASTGWPAVRKTCNQKLGVAFDDWQEGAGRLIMAKRADGNLAAMIDGVGMSIPRQVGKTYLVGAMVFALCVNQPGLLVIWSAHHARTHSETFLAMQGFASRAKVKGHVDQVFKGSGDEEIRFHNGSRVLFGARERGFGRGIPGVDVLIFDEAQILSDKALANMLATMNTSRFGLQLYIGTPPKPGDMCETFVRMRKEALTGSLHDGAWIEMGADADAEHSDRKQWAKANPSYPRRTPVQSILRLQRKLTPEDFRREGLGIWDDDASAGVFSSGAWARCLTANPPGAPAAFGIAADLEQTWLSLAAVSDDMVPHLAATLRCRFDIERARFVAETKRLAGGLPVAIDKKGPAHPLIPDLEEAGIRVVTMGLDDKVQADADIRDAVETGAVCHANYPELNAAIDAATWRKVGEGRRAFGRSPMLEAVSLALMATAANYDVMKSVW